MVKRKQLFILGGLAVVVVIIVILLVLNNSLKSDKNFSESAPNPVYEPEFMSETEKANLNLPADSKIQILKKDESGEATVYRIIRRDADIILDPNRVGEPGMSEPGSANAVE